MSRCDNNIGDLSITVIDAKLLLFDIDVAKKHFKYNLKSRKLIKQNQTKQIS